MLDVARLAQESPTPAAFEAAVLAWLQQQVGFVAAFFLVAGLERFPSVLGLDATLSSRLVARSRSYAEELQPVKQAALSARGVAVDTAVCGVSHVQQTHYYREIAAKIGGRHSLLAYLSWGGRSFGVIMLGRSGNSFTQQDVSLIESLLPSLGVARAAYGLAWAPEPLPGPAEATGRRWFRRSESRAPLACISTAAGDVIVRDRAGFREMVALNDGTELVWTRAALRDPRESGWPYVELLHLAPALAKQRQRALFIGCGGAVSLHQFASVYPGMQLDLVECDAAVIELALNWFNLGAIPNLTVHVADGAAFIRAAPPACWDVVVIDAFDASGCPAAFLAPDFLNALQRSLRPGGAMAWNVISSLHHGFASELAATLQRVFDGVRVVPVMEPQADCSLDGLTRRLRNIVVVATRL